MQAAELCLKALKIATDPSQRTEIRSNCQTLLDEAERIKLTEKWQPLVGVHSERLPTSQHSTCDPLIGFSDLVEATERER
jgi:calpain-7